MVPETGIEQLHELAEAHTAPLPAIEELVLEPPEESL
jgi:hypothetical protein